MKIHCPQCGQIQNAPAQFCNRCGVQFVVQPVKKSSGAGIAIVILAGVAMCGLCGLIGTVSDNFKNPQNNAITSNNIQATPVPTPEPKTPPEFLAAAKTMLTQKEMGVRDKAKGYLKQIPKDAAEYKEAQKMLADAVKNDVAIKREAEKKAKEEAEEAKVRAIIGERPSDADLHVAFNRYLRPRLNDYDSSEYVNYTSAYRTTVAGQPFWASVLRLRAKNAFGGYIIKDVTMYIRNKEVVLSDGL